MAASEILGAARTKFSATAAVDARSGIIGAIAFAGLTVVARFYFDISAIVSVALLFAGAAVTIVVLRRRRELQQELAHVLSEESSGDSALGALRIVRKLLDDEFDVAKARNLAVAIIEHRRHPHEEVLQFIIDSSNSSDAGHLSAQATRLEVRINDDRNRMRAVASEALQSALQEKGTLLLLYGYSRTVCEAVAASRPAGPVLVLEDRQYGREEDAEHVHVLDYLNHHGVDAQLVTFGDLDKLLQRDSISLEARTGRLLHLMSDRVITTVLGCDLVDERGGALVPGGVDGKPSESALLIDAMTRADSGSLVKRRIITLAENFKFVRSIAPINARSGAPIMMSRSRHLLHWCGLAVPVKIAPIRLREIGSGLTDVCMPSAYVSAEEFAAGALLPEPFGYSDLVAPEDVREDAEYVALSETVIDLLILDWNGVVINDEPLHEGAFAALVAEHGAALDGADYEECCHGRSDREGTEALIAHGLLSGDIAALEARKREIYHELANGSAVLTTGVVNFLQDASESGTAIWIVSASLESEIHEIVKETSLLGLMKEENVLGGFDEKARASVVREIVANSGSDRDRTLYVDDWIRGVDAARSVGVRAILFDAAHPQAFARLRSTVRFASHWTNRVQPS